jgi:hypothetical protein
MSQPAIIEAFAEVEDRRRQAGQRHTLPLCLALFTLAIAAGNKGFLAIGDWVTSYREQLIDLFKPPKIDYLRTARCVVPCYTSIMDNILRVLPNSLTLMLHLEKRWELMAKYLKVHTY